MSFFGAGLSEAGAGSLPQPLSDSGESRSSLGPLLLNKNCVCRYVRACLHARVCVCVYIYIYTYIYMYIYVYLYKHTQVYVKKDEQAQRERERERNMYIYICTSMYLFIYLHTHTYIRILGVLKRRPHMVVSLKRPWSSEATTPTPVGQRPKQTVPWPPTTYPEDSPCKVLGPKTISCLVTGPF